MDIVEDNRNSIVVSLATSGGIVVNHGKNKFKLTVSFPNQDKTIAEKEIFKTYIISKSELYDLECDAQELHAQINAMIEEEEAKKVEEEKCKLEEQRKKDEEKRIKQREARAAKKKQDEKPTEKDKGDK